MKVVFILNGLIPRALKRIDEFKKRGYDVEVYTFTRKKENVTLLRDYNVQIMDTFENGKGYISRIYKIYASLKKVVKVYPFENTLFYFFALPNAVIGRLLSVKYYIYEEGDMAHTYIKYKLIRYLLEKVDLYIINKSLETVLTSKGFVDYHYKGKMPDNVSIIENKLDDKIRNLKILDKTSTVNLRIGFVGYVRFKSILNFVEIYAENFPDHEFHFYGEIVDFIDDFKSLSRFNNVHFHGGFVNPQDLPQIYANIDLVLSAYDTTFENVRYAEPNKIYEAIYFETPIIVSTNTFLERKVLAENIGYAINPYNKAEIISFIETINKSNLCKTVDHIRSIDKEYAINCNDTFFEKLELKL